MTANRWSPFGGTPEHAGSLTNTQRGLRCTTCGGSIGVGVRIYRNRPPQTYGGPQLGLPGDTVHKPTYRHAECPKDN